MYDIFTYPEENRQHVGTSYELSENKLIQAMQNGEHLSVSLRHASRLPEEFSYTNAGQSENGVTTEWKLDKSERTATLERLSDMIKKYSKTDKDVDISKYENMSDAELMDATMRYISPDFWFTAQLELSNGYSIIEDHAYTLKSYDPEKKELVLANPHYSNEDIVIPLAIAEQFFEISV